ncbi:alpha/beta fold hydrolase [Paraburkholderia acidisoli]|uniref:Alpha/beta fold hydrolase n=1 Tax=Paraburkholderia acidisoli TaxID=2571748 RepID=A0A7Z2JF85_9BURK|nr:alpha/beta hydrolase [Paraburkholderia acidisoli]QGZ61673.1 alpha/beta fold hydrolase [Paraburkholderia acidisoli]
MTYADIGGRRLAYRASGAGSPSVVLETGLGAESAGWQAVQTALEGAHRVFRYDRAGRGQSEPAPTPRNLAQIVDDLSALLDAAHIPAPYLLVGHSFGALIVRSFAHRYPQTVCGMVLVEPMHEVQFERLGPAFPAASADDSAALSRMRDLWTTGWRDPATTPESIDFPASFRMAREAALPEGLPLTVLTAGSFRNASMFAQEQRLAMQETWEQMHAEWLTLSACSKAVSVPGSEHFVQRDAPEAIVEEIEAMVRLLPRSLRVASATPMQRG